MKLKSLHHYTKTQHQHGHQPYKCQQVSTGGSGSYLFNEVPEVRTLLLCWSTKTRKNYSNFENFQLYTFYYV